MWKKFASMRVYKAYVFLGAPETKRDLYIFIYSLMPHENVKKEYFRLICIRPAYKEGIYKYALVFAESQQNTKYKRDERTGISSHS